MDKSPPHLHNNDEEYHYEDESNNVGPATIEAQPERVSSGTPTHEGGGRKRILLIIGIIVAVFCLYKLYDVFVVTRRAEKLPTALTFTPTAHSSKETSSALNGTKPQESSASTLKTLPSGNETVNESNPKLGGAVLSSVTGETTDHIDNIKKAVEQNAQATQNLQQEIAALSNAISDIQNNISTLNQTLDGLKKSAAEKNTVVAEKIHKKIVKKRPAVVKPGKLRAVVTTNYYARAMIQGRAWLVTPEGATFTVSLGDELPGYGKIMAIDPENGAIMTSAGRVITYHPSDR